MKAAIAIALLISVNAGFRPPCHKRLSSKENEMTNGEIGMLALIVCSLGLLGGALAWASWQESRHRRNAGER